jgi:hypothetical protein
MANEIKLKLSVDGSAQVVSEVGRVGDKLRDMDAQARQNAQGVIALRGAFGSLAAVLAGGLSVAGLVAVANKAIDAADAMNDLSQRVGIAVKDLVKYELAASQSGTTMESLAKGIKGLAGNLMEHGDALKKAGITATTADGAMKQLADVFANMPDGMEKTTLAVKLFGKSGMDLIPMLNMGADGLEKTAEKSAKYAAQMAIMAPMADAYNDNMAEIAMSSKVVGMTIVNDMLPQMVSITGAMAMAAKESGILKAAWVGLGGAMDEFIAKPASVIFKGINNTLDEANAKLMRFFGKTAESDKLLAAVARRNKEILDLTDDASSPASSAPSSNGFDKAKWLADYKAMMDALGGGEKIKKVKEAAKEFKDLNEHVNEFAKANMKALEEDEKAREKYIDGLTKSADSIGEQVQKLRDEEQALGISTAQNISLAQALELVAIGRLHEEQAKQMSYGDEAAAAAIQTEIDKRRELLGLIGSKDAREANKKAVDELEKANQKAAEESEKFWTDALMRGFESGKGFFDNFWDTIKNKIKTDVLRVMVQPVAQGITGMLGLSGAANAAGTAGAASGIGTLGSVAAGVSAFGGTLATGFMNTLVGSGMSGGLTAAGAMIANGAWASGLGMAAGALGPIGLGIAALSMIGNKDKSTANTGNASARFDASGNRTDYQTYYGGSSDGVDKMLASLQTSYATTAKALGIAAAATQFSYGGNTGKNGESPNFALGGGAGNIKFYQGETASSDAAISLAASRAVFAALQGSDLPAYLAKVFNGATADALSQEQITNTLAYAASLKQVRDALLETREPMAVLQDNVTQAFTAMGTTADSFKKDFVTALDGGISPEKLAQWQSLQTAMTDLAALAEKDAASKAAAAKTIRDNVAKEIGIATSWAQKLAVLQGKTTERQLALEADLLTTNNDATKALIERVYALEDEKTAAEALKTTLVDTAAAMRDAQAAMQSFVSATQSITLSKNTLAGKSGLENGVTSAGFALDNAIQAIKDLGTRVGDNGAQDYTIAQIESVNLNDFASQKFAGEFATLLAGYWDAKVGVQSATDALSKAAIDNIPTTVTKVDTSAADATANERKGLQDQLDQLTLSSIDLMLKQRAALDESNRALFDSINTIKMQTAAQANADALKKANQGWQDQLDVLTGAKTQVQVTRANELAAATQDGTKALMQQVYAQQDLNTATEAATKAAKDAADAEAARLKTIADQTASLTTEWLQLIGDTVALRKQELAAIDESNRALKQQIWAYQDAQEALNAATSASDNALSGIQKALDAQKTAQTKAVDDVKGLFDLVAQSVKDLYSQVDTARAMQSAEAQAFIATAAALAKAGGALPDQAALGDAITAVKGSMSATQYASQADADFAKLVLAGQLKQIQDVAGTKLTDAQQLLATTNDAYDVAKNQLDTLRGINDSTLSVAAAVEAFQVAFTGEQTARQKLQAAQTVSAVANAGGGGGSGSQTLAQSMIERIFGSAASALSEGALAGITKQIEDGYSTQKWNGELQATIIGNAAANAAGAVQEAAIATATRIGLDLTGAAAHMTTGGGQAAVNALVAAGNATIKLNSYDVGTNYVPHDGPAYLHAGEAVVPRAYNPAAGGSSSARLEALVEGLTKEVQRLQGLVNDGNQHNRRTADAVNGNPEMPMLVETVV